MENSKIIKAINLFLGYCHEQSKAVESDRLARNVPLSSEQIKSIYGDKGRTKALKRKRFK